MQLLLVCHSNIDPVLHLFCNMATYRQKIAIFAYPHSSGVPAPDVPITLKLE